MQQQECHPGVPDWGPYVLYTHILWLHITPNSLLLTGLPSCKPGEGARLWGLLVPDTLWTLQERQHVPS